MGVQEFDLLYNAAREEYSRPTAMALAIEAFFLDIYRAMGMGSFYAKDMPLYATQLYDEYRAVNFSHEKAWLLCERSIINTAQQDFIDTKQRAGYTKHEAYVLCRAKMRSQCGKCPVFEQYKEILTPETPGSRSDYCSTYTEERRPGYTSYTYTTYRRHPTSSASSRTPPLTPDSYQQARYPSGPSQPRPFNTPQYEYRRPRNPQYEPSTSHSTRFQPSPPPPPRRSVPPPSASTYTRPHSPPPSPPAGVKPPTCLYVVLGIPRSATAEDIKKAHRKLMLKWHPDRNHGKEEEATRQAKVINEARDVLVDGEARAFYDQTGCMP